MSSYEVPEPILNSPFEEPREHWHIVEGETPRKLPGRRPAMYFYRDPKAKPEKYAGSEVGTAIELKLVNRIRGQVKAWKEQGYPGVTRTTLELLQWWQRDGREKRLFFAQLEAAETIIFLTEARQDFRQGIEIPREEVSEDKKEQGYSGFVRYACKMATGTGKTTVMAMLAAWSILNKVNDRSDGRFSDVVLIICPNVTIRGRLGEVRPEEGEASLYRTRDLVPPHLMPLLAQGRVLVTNWHVFEPQTIQTGGVSAKVSRAGVAVRTRETITIGAKTTTARGTRYLTQEDLERQVAAGLLTVLEEYRDKKGHLQKISVESVRYVESDTSLVNRVLGREVGGKQNILVVNDEAHHAYRIKREERDEEEEDLFGEEEQADVFFKEATVWVDSLDRVQKLRGINLCVDLSATPYFLGRVGQETNRPFPWVVADFGLIDAIESGLVKIPQLAVRDTTGAAIPGYFNIWHWILPQLTPAERGGEEGQPEAGSDPEVRPPSYRHAGRPVGEGKRGVGKGEPGSAPSGLHPGLQEHADCPGYLRMAGGGQGAHRDSLSKAGGIQKQERRYQHDSRGFEGYPRDRHRRGQERRGPLDALHLGHRRQDGVAYGSFWAADLSGRL